MINQEDFPKPEQIVILLKNKYPKLEPQTREQKIEEISLKLRELALVKVKETLNSEVDRWVEEDRALNTEVNIKMSNEVKSQMTPKPKLSAKRQRPTPKHFKSVSFTSYPDKETVNSEHQSHVSKIEPMQLQANKPLENPECSVPNSNGNLEHINLDALKEPVPVQRIPKEDLSHEKAKTISQTASPLNASKKELEASKPKSSGISYLVWSGFITALGITAIALAFTVLNAATGGAAGLTMLSLGVATLLTGAGIFAKGYRDGVKSQVAEPAVETAGIRV